MIPWLFFEAFALRLFPSREEQDLLRPFSNPSKADGHIQILFGNLAPEGAVAKITGKEGTRSVGPASVFDSEEGLNEGLTQGKFEAGQVVIIRYVGPKGGPGMPEMLKPASVIIGAGLGDKAALVTDNRFSGGTHGFVIGHVWWVGDGRLYFDNGNIGSGGTRHIGRISGPHPEQLQNQWHHLCYQVDAAANQMRVFVDGQLFLQENHYDTFKNQDCDFIIGGPAGIRYYGAMSEFRIWNYVRTPQQIQDSMLSVVNSPQLGPIGCWKLNEIEIGKQILDRSGNNYNPSCE